MLEKYSLPERVRHGRGVTADIKPRLAGFTEFWECIKTTPASELQKCLPLLENQEIDITKVPKLPIKAEIKPNWIWLALGFMAGWILKK